MAAYPHQDGRFLEVRTISALDLLVVRGWSVSANVDQVYMDILEFIPAHLSVKDNLTIFFKYELFNPTTTRYLFKIIMLLNREYAKGKNVKIQWDCGDMMDEMMDTGFDLAQLCEFEFNITLL